MDLYVKWNSLVNSSTHFYIFGASSVAKRLFTFFDALNKSDCILGFLVSDTSNNPSTLFNKPVLSFHTNSQKNIPVIMSISPVYHADTFEQLRQDGYTTILEGHLYYSLDIASTNSIQPIPPILSEDDLKDYALSAITQNNPAFATEIFYQSYPPLNWDGERVTDVRYSAYQLDSILAPIWISLISDVTLALLIFILHRQSSIYLALSMM